VDVKSAGTKAWVQYLANTGRNNHFCNLTTSAQAANDTATRKLKSRRSIIRAHSALGTQRSQKVDGSQGLKQTVASVGQRGSQQSLVQHESEKQDHICAQEAELNQREKEIIRREKELEDKVVWVWSKLIVKGEYPRFYRLTILSRFADESNEARTNTDITNSGNSGPDLICMVRQCGINSFANTPIF